MQLMKRSGGDTLIDGRMFIRNDKNYRGSMLSEGIYSNCSSPWFNFATFYLTRGYEEK